MTKEYEEDLKNDNNRRFCEKKLNLIKLEIIVTLQENIEVQPIIYIILTSQKQLILYHSYFTILEIIIAICSSKN